MVTHCWTMSAKPKLFAPISSVTASTLWVVANCLQLHHLALAGGAVVPVEPGLERAAGLRVRACAGAGEVQRSDAAADVHLGCPRAVAARDRLAGTGRRCRSTRSNRCRRTTATRSSCPPIGPPRPRSPSRRPSRSRALRCSARRPLPAHRTSGSTPPRPPPPSPRVTRTECRVPICRTPSYAPPAVAMPPSWTRRAAFRKGCVPPSAQVGDMTSVRIRRSGHNGVTLSGYAVAHFPRARRRTRGPRPSTFARAVSFGSRAVVDAALAPV